MSPRAAAACRIYDVASIGNKGVRSVRSPRRSARSVHDTHIGSKDATCIALPTNQPIHPPRNTGDKMRKANLEQPFHPMYNYAYITDAQEGLILTEINTLADGDPRNNYLKRALTWNPNGALNGARHIAVGGSYLYIATKRGLAIVSVDVPLSPQLIRRGAAQRRARRRPCSSAICSWSTPTA
jgi:hypothetical protein